MRKEDVAGIVVFIAMIAVLLFVGLYIIRPALEVINVGNSFVFVAISIVAGIIISVTLNEVGHLLGALIGGYSIMTFNVLGLCLYKNKGKWAFGIKSFEGLTGEVKIAPKSEKANPKPYLIGSVFLFLIEVIISVLVLAFLPEDSAFKYAVIIVLAINGMFEIYNIVPLKLDSVNDGYRFVLLSKPINKEAFNEVLRIESLARDGVEATDIRVFEEITDYTAQVNLVTVYSFLRNEEFSKAMPEIERIIANKDKVSYTTYIRVLAQKLYIYLVSKPLEEAKEFYEVVLPSERKDIANDLSMESIRAYVLIAGLLDLSKGEVLWVCGRKKRALKRTLPAYLETESMLFDKAYTIVNETHPDWELNEFAR